MRSIFSVAIASAASLSAAVDLGESGSLIGFQTDAAFTAGAVTFQGSTDGTTFVPVNDADGSAISIAASPSNYYSVDPAVFLGLRYIKISGAVQGSDTVLSAVARKLD